MLRHAVIASLFLAVSSFASFGPDTFTVVHGAKQSWLVSEFTGSIGCDAVSIDSIVTGIPAGMDGDHTTGVRTVYWNHFEPKLAPAQATVCQATSRLRRIDPLPHADSAACAKCDTVEASVTLVFACSGGICKTVPLRTVETAPDYRSSCIEGALPPLDSLEAVTLLLTKLAAAQEAVVLTRYWIITIDQFSGVCLDGSSAVAARTLAASSTTTTSDSVVADRHISTDLASYTYWNDGTLDLSTYAHAPLLPDSVDSSLAHPTGSSIGDTYAPDTVRFLVTGLTSAQLRTSETRTYQPGSKSYRYRADHIDVLNCKNDTASTRLRDTLLLSGTPLVVSNADTTCAHADQDIFTSVYGQWLVLRADTSVSFQSQFRHSSSAENDVSWPVVDDSVHVRGQKIPLSLLRAQAATSIKAQTARSAFRAQIRNNTLEMELPTASTVDLLAPDGRHLGSRIFPAGHSSMALPSQARGLVLVRNGASTVRVLAP